MLPLKRAASPDASLAAHLPTFFRALSGQKPAPEERKKLLAVIKGTRAP
jgi:hypothetical protein